MSKTLAFGFLSLRTPLLAVALLAATSHAALRGRMIDDSIFSPTLNAKRQMLVYLPPEAATEPARKFPAILFLHGATSNPVEYAGVIEAADQLMAARLMQPTIVILPDGSNEPWAGSFYTNSAVNGRFEDFIVQDVIDAAESRHPVQKDAWAISGHSMGGFGTMKVTMLHPERFRAAASLSGPLDLSKVDILLLGVLLEQGGAKPVYDPAKGLISGLAFSMARAFSPNPSALPAQADFPIDAQGKSDTSVLRRWMAHSPAALARTAKGRLPPLYFDCGTNDALQMPPFNQGFRDSLAAAGIPFRYDTFAGGHSDKLGERVPIALRFLDSVFALPAGLPPRQEPRIQLSIRRVGDQLQIVAPSTFSDVAWTASLHDLQGRQRAQAPSTLRPGGAWTIPQELSRGLYVVRLTAIEPGAPRTVSRTIDLVR